MKQNQHICTQLEEKARAFTQITLDDDYIVRDNKPDALPKIYRIEKKKLFYILFKLETLLEFMDFNCSESSFRLTKWLRKEILLEEETLDVLKSKDFSYKFVRKIQKIDSKFFKVK